ncbi:hypothetical protein BT93_L0359 [Corymbia citriodora subsp. variegata]|uniref:Uncharacterized protein n=1 Tax=Corymbia citriodora subsp. variegata TaxID=360336 RepID=A0A8T0CIS3_CORYI|nr:hypothetical protein BT93_L0359 [Corymbia citriodora subsp. variegata]
MTLFTRVLMQTRRTNPHQPVAASAYPSMKLQKSSTTMTMTATNFPSAPRWTHQTSSEARSTASSSLAR